MSNGNTILDGASIYSSRKFVSTRLIHNMPFSKSQKMYILHAGYSKLLISKTTLFLRTHRRLAVNEIASSDTGGIAVLHKTVLVFVLADSVMSHAADKRITMHEMIQRLQ